MAVHFHVDGRRVHLNDDWEATSTSAGGYEQLTATADRHELLHLHQGSRVTLVTDGGKELWYGTLDATPATSRLPTVHLTATGPVSRLRRARANRLYQSRDYGAWAPQDSDPYGMVNSPRIQADAQGGRLNFISPNATDEKNGQKSGLAFWAPGENVTNVAFDWTANVASTDFVLQVFSGTGPSGAMTQRGGNITLNAVSGSVSQAITTTDDLLAIRLMWNTADATSTQAYKLGLTNLRVNGRWSGDTASPGDIISDLASAVGLDVSNVRSSGQNALPFYWTGGSWGDAVTELAALDDWPWVVHRGEISYGAWDPGWHLYFAAEGEDLDWPPVYNSVRVFYTTPAGASRSLQVVADPDPLSRYGVDNEYQYDIGNSYANDDIPTAVANALLEGVSQQRVVGTVTVVHGHRTGRVWTPQRRFSTFAEDHYRIRPGTLGHLEPYPGLPPQRIVGVRLRADGVTVELGEDAEIAATRVLARLALGRARAHKSKKKGP